MPAFKQHQLEILKSIPSGKPRPTPLLFVHGAFSAAWCWAEYFLPYFARHGYAAYAVSLRGHGASDGHDELPITGIADYVEDVRRAARELPDLPVLIGHSMGGMVIQRYMELFPAAAGVLLASVPPQGLFVPTMDLMLRDPLLFQEMQVLQQAGQTYVSFANARRAVFSDALPEARAREYLHLMQRESYQAFIDMTWFPGSPVRNANGNPVLVLGGGVDTLFPPRFVHATASAYRTEAAIFPEIAHAMMLEPAWRDVAEHILGWLESQDL